MSIRPFSHLYSSLLSGGAADRAALGVKRYVAARSTHNRSLLRRVSRPSRDSSRSRCSAIVLSSTVMNGSISFSSPTLQKICSSAVLSLESSNTFHCSKLHPHLQPLHRRCKFVLLFPLSRLQLPFPLALCPSAIELASSFLAQAFPSPMPAVVLCVCCVMCVMCVCVCVCVCVLCVCCVL